MMYGPQRLLSDLRDFGYRAEIADIQGNQYIVIRDYQIEIGRFKDQVIDLGVLATPDYPRTVASAIHIHANPQLLEKSDSVSGVRNIIDSQLGGEWRYWSYDFQWAGGGSTRRLISQINGIFKDA